MTQTYVCNVNTDAAQRVARLVQNLTAYADALSVQGRSDEADDVRRHVADLTQSTDSPTGNQLDMTPPVMPATDFAQ